MNPGDFKVTYMVLQWFIYLHSNLISLYDQFHTVWEGVKKKKTEEEDSVFKESNTEKKEEKKWQ